MTPTKLLVPTYAQMLRALSGWLEKAAEASGGDPGVLSARLAPDMFPLSTQIRFACVQACEGVWRLRAEPLPAFHETLTNEGRAGGERPVSFADAQDRIAETLALLEGVGDSDLDPGAERPLAIELPMGLAFDMTGEDYVRDWALPQFYFHLVAAYAILRAEGVALGKADYVAHAFAYLRPAADRPAS